MDATYITPDALPTPECPDGLGNHCPGPFETVTSTARPGEIDATVRCRECGACAHYVLDANGRILDTAELAALRAGQPISTEENEVNEGTDKTSSLPLLPSVQNPSPDPATPG